MSTQSDALLSLVEGYNYLPPDERLQREAALYGNPVICTPIVIELAERDASEAELRTLSEMRDRGLIMVADDPDAKRVELHNRPGYENREARRARRRKIKRKK